MDQSPVQGVLSKCLKGFIVSEVNCDLEQARGPSLQHVQQPRHVILNLYLF